MEVEFAPDQGDLNSIIKVEHDVFCVIESEHKNETVKAEIDEDDFVIHSQAPLMSAVDLAVLEPLLSQNRQILSMLTKIQQSVDSFGKELRSINARVFAIENASKSSSASANGHHPMMDLNSFEINKITSETEFTEFITKIERDSDYRLKIVSLPLSGWISMFNSVISLF